MRRLVLPFLLAIAFVVPAAALALERSASDGTLSVKHGNGLVFLRLNGAIIGRVGHGEVTVIDPVTDDGTGPTIWGCDHRSNLSDNTPSLRDTVIVCSGDDLRFRMAGGVYKVAARGVGIFVSAVGHGLVRFDGRGDDAGVSRDGIYSINDAPFASLPDTFTELPVAAPSGG